jgi:DNA-binding response OmpR family regulator
MNGNEPRPVSVVREGSPFPAPPRVRVVTDRDRVPEAVALVEALDERGAEAEVRLAEDAAATGYDHVRPDAIVIDLASAPEALAGQRRGADAPPVLVALTDGDYRGQRRAREAGYDLVVARPVDPSALMARLGEYLFGART